MKRNFGKSRMKSEESVKRRLRKVEKLMSRLDHIETDSGSSPIFSMDGWFAERHTLRWVLGIKHEPFCAADTLVGWLSGRL